MNLLSARIAAPLPPDSLSQQMLALLDRRYKETNKIYFSGAFTVCRLIQGGPIQSGPIQSVAFIQCGPIQTGPIQCDRLYTEPLMYGAAEPPM